MPKSVNRAAAGEGFWAGGDEPVRVHWPKVVKCPHCKVVARHGRGSHDRSGRLCRRHCRHCLGDFNVSPLATEHVNADGEPYMAVGKVECVPIWDTRPANADSARHDPPA